MAVAVGPVTKELKHQPRSWSAR